MSHKDATVRQVARQVAEDIHLDGFTAEEEPLLPPHAPQGTKTAYVNARNLLLYIWRSDITQYLSLESATKHSLIPPRLRTLARIAWHFLDARGYINFGVAPAILQRMHNALEATGPIKGSVVVIGAGLAGLAAAHQLQRKGYKVAVLEAKGHSGGRVETVRLEGVGHEAVVDLGGAVVTGVNGNPLAVLARQLGTPLHRIDAEQRDCPLYQGNGKVVSRAMDNLASEVFLQAEEAALQVPEQYSAAAAEAISFGTFMKVQLAGKDTANGTLAKMLQWLYTNAEFSAAALATELSVTRWSDDDHFGFSGDHAWLPGGNARLIKALADHVPILYHTPASRVAYGKSGATVETEAGTAISADACVVTVPLGVLKRGHIEFAPPLPEAKLAAIHRLGFGVLNKVALLFAERWWGEHDTFGHVADSHEEPGWFYLWYTFPGLSGGHMIAALVSGEAAVAIEAQSDAAVLQRVMHRLRTYHPDCSIPDPVAAAITAWGRDPYTLGSYSSVPPGCNGADDYNEVARNVEGRLFFAGEATSYRYPAQMHGAYDSGLREAAKVDAALSQPAAGAPAAGAAAATATPAAPQDARSPHELVQALAHSLHLHALLDAEFANGADASGPCWDALLALGGLEGVREFAVLRVRPAEPSGGVSRSGQGVTQHVVPLEMVLELSAQGLKVQMHDVVADLVKHNAASIQGRGIPSDEELQRLSAMLAARGVDIAALNAPSDGSLSAALSYKAHNLGNVHRQASTPLKSAPRVAAV